MTAEQHAARMAQALRQCITEPSAYCYRSGTASAFDLRLVCINHTAREALEAWDRRNAPPPKQPSLL